MGLRVQAATAHLLFNSVISSLTLTMSRHVDIYFRKATNVEDRGQTKPQKRPKDTKTMQEEGKFLKILYQLPERYSSPERGCDFSKEL